MKGLKRLQNIGGRPLSKLEKELIEDNLKLRGIIQDMRNIANEGLRPRRRRKECS